MKHLNFSSLQSFKTITFVILLGTVNLAVAQSEDRVLAIVNGREVRQREVDQLLISQIMPLEEQLYAIRKASLENAVLTVLLEAEAARRGISPEELRKTLTAGDVEVKAADVESAYAENAAAFGAMSPDEAKERLRLDLETQARMAKYRQAVATLRQAAVVETFLAEPRWPWSAMAEAAPALGSTDSLVTIIEFADFQCPYCRHSQGVIKRVLSDYGKDVRLVFKHLPLDAHSQATTAARAAFCAGKQDRFWEYQEALFSMAQLQTANLRHAAANMKLDLTKFDVCLDSNESQDAVAKDKRDAALWGINSTPTFIVNGKIVQGAIDFDAFKALIGRELTSARNKTRSAESGAPDARRKK